MTEPSSPVQGLWRTPTARIILEQRKDGGLTVYSDDVPMRGLLISGPDRNQVMADVLRMVESFQTYRAPNKD